jgi:hypothetical protein
VLAVLLGRGGGVEADAPGVSTAVANDRNAFPRENSQ